MSFKLDTFQIKAIDAIDSGINVLITAPTGSGKTLPAEHAIVKFCKQGKKVIYTTPIKALSNQKYRDFTEKFPELSFGLITGDNRNNPEADCLIMTTEILNNTLFHMKNTNITKDTLHFQIDLQNDLAAVVFDEVHYINDWERGHIWEKCMARLPEHVVQIMLSATLSHPEIIPDWFKTVLNREVVLCEHSQRSVPLEHAIFVSYPDSAINKIKPPKLKKFCENVNNQVLQLKLGNKSFNTDNYNKFYKIYNAISGRISDKFVIKKMHHYLKTNDLLPAITFVLSRSQIEKFARQTELVLFSEDDTRRSTIANECKRLLKRIPNWEEYTKLQEYNFYLKILEKGYGIHHSGMIPVFRELMEILFETGYIKMLYATETFAIGMNMPTRAVVFTSLQKFDGTQFRNFYSHEYTQTAGRAGRRGLDPVGKVFHLSNLRELPSLHDYDQMLQGRGDQVASQFVYDSQFALQQYQHSFPNNLLFDYELLQETSEKQSKLTQITDKIQSMKSKEQFLSTPVQVINEYSELQMKINLCKPKQKKKLSRAITNCEENYKKVKTDWQYRQNLQGLIQEQTKLVEKIQHLTNYSQENQEVLQELFQTFHLIDDGKLTIGGQIALQVYETHVYVIPSVIINGMIHKLSQIELICFLSCFLVHKDNTVKPIGGNLQEIVDHSKQVYDTVDNYLARHWINERMKYFQTNYIETVKKWCDADTTEKCIEIVNNYEFHGDFVKMMLKICNMIKELVNIAEKINDLKLLEILENAENKILKSIVTNQSLYF